MSMKLAPALIIALLPTASPATAQELAGPTRPERFAAARLVFTPAPDVTRPPAQGTAAIPSAFAATPGRAPRTRMLALGVLGGAAGATLGCVIGDCGGDFLHPPDDALLGGLLGAVVGLVIALWVEPDDDWPSPRLPPRPR